MADTSITAAQKLIDGKAYPPTHHYDVETLTPHWPLSARLELILNMCPHFFHAEHFLDVGCSKGFFSLLAAKTSDFVLAVDPDQEALNTWEAPANVRKLCSKFTRFAWYFDRIWIGNGHHYLWRDSGPSYMKQIFDMATDLVLIEGPTGPECPDLQGFEGFPDEDEFLQLMKSDFVLLERRDSVSYTPGRAMWLFKTN